MLHVSRRHSAVHNPKALADLLADALPWLEFLVDRGQAGLRVASGTGSCPDGSRPCGALAGGDLLLHCSLARTPWVGQRQGKKQALS